MIEITLPDGTKQKYDKPVKGKEIAKQIGPKLFKDAIALEINNSLYDLNYKINDNCNVRIITTKDPDAISILRRAKAS